MNSIFHCRNDMASRCGESVFEHAIEVMMRSRCRSPHRLVLGFSLLLAAFGFSGAAIAQPAGAPPGAAAGTAGGGPLEVGVIEVAEETVPYIITVPGRAVAYEQVDIRPRVNGVISEIVYEPGRPASVGDVLFRIENQTYAAEVQSAEAEVARAEAELSGARSILERYRTLEGTGVTSAEVQSAEVSFQQAEASVSAAQATLEMARLELEWTEIRSPIEGIPDVAAVSVGAIVTANQTDALTTVTRLDPIYVDVEESSVRIQRIRQRVQAGNLRPGEGLDVRLKLETGVEYEGRGQMVSPGTSVSTTTGTTELRIQFDNPQRVIMPGQFLRVDITLGTTEAMLVPQRATQRAADGTLTAFVARDGKAVQATLTEAGSYQNSWIVTEGLEPGDHLIVDNFGKVASGAEVTTVPVTISDGVVQDAESSAEKPTVNGQEPTADTPESQTPEEPAQGNAPVTEE